MNILGQASAFQISDAGVHISVFRSGFERHFKLPIPVSRFRILDLRFQLSDCRFAACHGAMYFQHNTDEAVQHYYLRNDRQAVQHYQSWLKQNGLNSSRPCSTIIASSQALLSRSRFCGFGEGGSNGASPLIKGRKRWDHLVTEAPSELRLSHLGWQVP